MLQKKGKNPCLRFFTYTHKKSVPNKYLNRNTMVHRRIISYPSQLTKIKMENDEDKSFREDLLFVCHHSAVANNDPSVLRSLLFRKTQITPNSWQGFALSSDLWDNLSLSEGERISRIRSNHTRMIEGYLIELASSFGGFSKQILAIAHAVEYFLFITSPNFSKYDDIDQLRRRSLQMIHFMAQRIRIRRKKAYEKT